MPTVLRPLEKVVSLLGADLNEVPGYVDAKHTFTGLKTDDWIALDEGSWFYMPSLYPAASFSQAMEVLQTQDAMIKEIPEVENVLGKIGRVESALDPAPAAMVETYVMLKPREAVARGVSRSDRSGMKSMRLPLSLVLPPASALQPIEGRVVMLQSGIKASMAVRIYGDDLKGLSKGVACCGRALKKHHYVNAGTVNPDIVMGKPYYEFEVDREEAARYGMTTMMVNQIVSAGLGGVDVTTTVEGRERYPIQIRYERSVRERVDDLRKVSVVTHTSEVVPLERLAQVTTTWGPGAINSEDARLVAHVSFSPSGGVGDLETVEAVMASLRSARESGELQFPPGNFELQAVGSFQNQIEANRRSDVDCADRHSDQFAAALSSLPQPTHLTRRLFGNPRGGSGRHDRRGRDGRGYEHGHVGRVHRAVWSGRGRRDRHGHLHARDIEPPHNSQRAGYSRGRL